jgi:catechol 2,3-dioxygenase-like lactoylglutathione lyase family enzyme
MCDSANSAAATPSIGLRGLHHASRTVGDMDRALAFYRDLIGLRVVADEELSGEAIERTTQVAGARIRCVELGSPGPQPRALVELLQYRAPDGAAIHLRLCDLGAHHLCFEVADIELAHQRLVQAGIDFTCPPQRIAGGFFAGQQCAYCTDFEGLVVELWQTVAEDST